MHKNKIFTAMALSSVIFISSSGALAELYVSPVVRESVTFDEKSSVEKNSDSGAFKTGSQVSGESNIHGGFVMRENTDRLSTVMAYGQNVPLFIAVERVVPNSADWKINVDSGLENSVVNWEGGETWEGVLENIAKQNGLYLTINSEEKAIGITKVEGLSQHLAMKSPQVWRLESGKSLRQNLSAWATRAGWKLEWDQKLDFDYPITHSAVLTGKFVGEGGVVQQVLDSIKDRDKPLRPIFYTQNSVLLITEAGYQQEVAF